jgi:hypothetical protein
MANYNLINSGLIETNVLGNKQLSTEELAYLYNGNTTTSGITILDTDILYIDIDLFNRINVEDFKLYINVVGDRTASLVNVDFYYKNLIDDNYTLCSKEHDLETFYPINLPELFAPRFFRIVISSLECSIFEIELTNEDDNIAFGDDGNQSFVTVDHTYGNYTTLPIFNNADVDTSLVNAYVLVDYQGNASDFYLALSDSPDGEYKGLSSGAMIETDDTSFNYTWSRGVFYGTYVNGDNIEHDPTFFEDSSYYTTTVISFGDPLMSSFLITNKTVPSGTSITWGSSEYQDTVKIRSSNTPPLPFTKFFITSTESDYMVNICKADMTSGAMDIYSTITTTSTSNNSVLFDKSSGTFLILFLNTTVKRFKYDWLLDYDTVNDTNGGIIASSSSSADNGFKNNWAVDGNGNVWGYVSNSGYKLRFLNAASLDATTVLTDSTNSFVTDLSANLRHSSCWFTDPTVKMLKHVDYSGDLIVSTSMNNPTYVTSLYDGGCLVVDAGTSNIIRLDYYGEVVSEISYPSTYSIVDIDYNISEEITTQAHEVFWILTSTGYVYQYSFSGEIISDIMYISATSIHAFLGGCLVHCSSSNKTYQLNSDGVQSREWDYSSLDTMGVAPFPISMTYDEYLKQTGSSQLLPVKSDPVWGSDSDAGWEEVNDDGYLLPFSKYHQLKYKFNTARLEVPIVNGGFETGDFTGWYDVSYNCTISTKSYEGTYGFRLDTNYGNFNCNLYQMINLSDISGIDFDILDFNSQGYIFNLNFWILWYKRYQDYNGYYSRVYLDFYNNTSQSIPGFQVYKHFEHGDSYWRNINLKTKLPTGTRYVRIRVFAKKYYYDYNTDVFDCFKAQITHSPQLNTIGMPEPIKLVDIAPQTSKNVYLKTDFPVGTVDKNYETRLKCWWGAQEE